ncbi:hypothetical protein ES319_A10G049800v1 [Gossypium barbadense]|uniref:B3 domain-containing protein At1g78640 n=2 Tax=Gossypium TaxID=3633 RepID=A0A1U8ILM9_GOSHI|nr:putative B3 domain-containing protein At1g78640 [Gossypium hirsutum]KAB2060883.1 hypothetical protein ES319_A10G049800v1 [Gossypium barbadense]
MVDDKPGILLNSMDVPDCEESNVSLELSLSSWSSVTLGRQEIHYNKLQSRIEKSSGVFRSEPSYTTSKISLELSISVDNMSTKTDERKQAICYEESNDQYTRKLDATDADISLELSLSMNKPPRVEVGERNNHYKLNINEALTLATTSDNFTSNADSSLEWSLSMNKPPGVEVGERNNHHKLKINEALTLATTSDKFTSKKRQTMGKLTNGNKRNKVEIPTEVRHHDDPWCIKKKLYTSDLGNMSRLILPSELVESRILSHWNTDQLAQIEEGLPVLIWDCDTRTEHEMKFKRWKNGANVLIKNWITQFVKRRELKQGDEIGIFWDIANSRFKFSVLNRAPMLYQ